MCIAGRFEMMAESERLNTHSIEVDSEKRLNMSNCCAQVTHYLTLEQIIGNTHENYANNI